MQRSIFHHYQINFFLAVCLLFIMPAASANSEIDFLGQPTSIEDRVTPSGDLLSDVLADLDRGCKDSSLAEARDKLEKKLDRGKITEESDKFLKERVKRYFKCLKKAIHKLKKDDVLAKGEEKELRKIIKQARKDGIIIDVEPEPSSTVSGRVTMPDGSTLHDVEILASSDTDDKSTSSVDGLFSLDLNPDSEYVLRLSRAGLADQVVPVMTPADGGAINIEITMIARGEAQTFSAGDGSVLTGADGASVDVSTVGWVDAAGNPVSGNIVATITPVDVSNSAILGAFPGEFSGISAGAEGPIVSLGVVEFEFTQNGAPVQPIPGSMVNILIPIYFTTNQDGMTPITEGQIIPIWSLDEATGIWTQDGEGSVVISPESPSGWALAAQVGHFSWWNCDVSMNAATALVTVFGDMDGTAVVRATTDASIGWRPNTVETVLAIGETSGPLNIPSTGEVCFSADITFDNGSTATTIEVCRTPSPNGQEIIDLFAPLVGPLNISRSPLVDIDGFVGFPVDRVRIFPTTLETSVTYSISSGALPSGLSLVQITPTQAEIAGVPVGVGAFTVTVEGDNGAETSSVVVNYDISSDEPPPVFADNPYIQLLNVNDTHDFNSNLNLVEGGAADFWEIIADEGGPIPAWLEFDEMTGILTLVDAVDEYYFGRIRAINESGDSEVFFDVCAGFGCEFES